ncbi:YbaB/EbfC family nucleoid-associated protein [Actinoplanes sp. NPDC049118]|uniref:YbaB/EbfC family nucleoid-associated protein n=1 Tax=Actinoplanes sp. NPDC049118 TaxID=3155769 RepID=UPI003400D470
MSDTEAFLDPDASREYLRSWQSRVEERSARALDMAAQLQQLRTTAKDDNGLAEVTIDSSGVLLHLELTERIHRYQPDVVARAVMDALRQARTKAAEQAQQIAVAALGPDSLSARTIAEQMRQVLERPDSGDDVPGRNG